MKPKLSNAQIDALASELAKIVRKALEAKNEALIKKFSSRPKMQVMLKKYQKLATQQNAAYKKAHDIGEEIQKLTGLTMYGASVHSADAVAVKQMTKAGIKLEQFNLNDFDIREAILVASIDTQSVADLTKAVKKKFGV